LATGSRGTSHRILQIPATGSKQPQDLGTTRHRVQGIPAKISWEYQQEDPEDISLRIQGRLARGSGETGQRILGIPLEGLGDACQMASEYRSDDLG
jgi:hypothetical protein